MSANSGGRFSARPYRGPARRSTSRAWEHFEWLAGVLAALDRKAGTLIVFDESYLAGVVEGGIRLNREMLLVEQSLRTVILASAETIPAAPPATGAMADG